MRIENLPSPGLLSMGMQLRTQASKAISAVETVAGLYPNGKAPAAVELSAFFAACKTAADAVADVAVPTLVTARVRASAPTKIELTFSEPLNGTIVPAIAAFAAAGVAKTITGVAVVSETKVFLTVTVAYVEANFPAATIAYTQPGTNRLQDLSGNLVASFGATAMAWIA